MEQNPPDLLTESFLEVSTKPRKELLPWWIKIFSWIFLVMGVGGFLGFIAGLFGANFELTIFGFKTTDPMSVVGVCIIVIFISKGIASFGLLWVKDWGINFAIIDAIFSLLICLFAMFYPVIFSKIGTSFTFRPEILIIIPYLIRLVKIKPLWENRIDI